MKRSVTSALQVHELSIAIFGHSAVCIVRSVGDFTAFFQLWFTSALCFCQSKMRTGFIVILTPVVIFLEIGFEVFPVRVLPTFIGFMSALIAVRTH